MLLTRRGKEVGLGSSGEDKTGDGEERGSGCFGDCWEQVEEGRTQDPQSSSGVKQGGG